MDWNKIGEGVISSGLQSLSTKGIGIVGDLALNPMRRNNMRLQNELEKDIMNHQYDLYSPYNQVARLKQAGLNAGLMYSGNGMQTGGATGSIGLASDSGGSAPMGNPLMVSEMKVADSVEVLNRAKAAHEDVATLLDQEKIVTERIDQLRIKAEEAESQAAKEYYLQQAQTESVRRDELRKQIEVHNSTITKNNAEADYFTSGANYKRALTLTEDELREFKVAYEKLLPGHLKLENGLLMHEQRAMDALTKLRNRERQHFDALQKQVDAVVKRYDKLNEMTPWQKAKIAFECFEHLTSGVNDITASIARFIKEDEPDKNDEEINKEAKKLIAQMIFTYLTKSK